jgi:hypothetical protein
VLDAFDEGWTYYDDIGPANIGAALRAAADQICMKQPLGSTDADAGVFAAHHAISTSLLAIADELDGLS